MVLARTVRRPGRRRLAAALLGLALVVGAGCTGEQDPGVVPDERPHETSDTLGRCPDGGPDATTPQAGCLDASGRVVRP